MKKKYKQIENVCLVHSNFFESLNHSQKYTNYIENSVHIFGRGYAVQHLTAPVEQIETSSGSHVTLLIYFHITSDLPEQKSLKTTESLSWSYLARRLICI